MVVCNNLIAKELPMSTLPPVSQALQTVLTTAAETADAELHDTKRPDCAKFSAATQRRSRGSDFTIAPAEVSTPGEAGRTLTYYGSSQAATCPDARHGAVFE